MMRRFLVGVAFFVALTAGAAYCAPGSAVVIDVWELPGVTAAADPAGTAGLGDALAGRLRFEVVPANLQSAYGKASSLRPLVVWVRIPAPPMPQSGAPWYFQGNRYLGHATLYVKPLGATQYASSDFGTRVPYADRAIARALPTTLVPTPLEARSPMYLRAVVDLEYLPLYVENQAALDAQDTTAFRAQRSVFLLAGIFLALGVCNLLVFASTRELPYALYSVSMLILAAVGPMQSNELAWEILWPHAALSDMWTRYPALFLEGYVSFAFVYSFLRTWEYAPALDKLARVVLVGSPILDFVAVYLFPSVSLSHGLMVEDLQALMMTVMFALMVVLGAAGVKARVRGAWPFLIAYGVVAVTYSIYAYSSYYWNDWSRSWSYFLLLYGRVFEGLVLFWALADRLQWTMKAHLAARGQALEATQQLLLETKISTSDPLTGIANRRAFDRTLAAELLRTGRSATPLSLLMLDVDNFKLYNDRYGHVAGDECLKRVAQAISIAVGRPDDLVARYGGEEFAVVLPNTDEAGALAIGAAICAAVYGERIVHEGSSHEFVSVSIGVATGRSSLEHASGLIQRADDGLYRAKGTGRNRVATVVATPPDTLEPA